MAIDVIQLKCKENKTRNHRSDDLRPAQLGLAWPGPGHNKQQVQPRPSSLPPSLSTRLTHSAFLSLASNIDIDRAVAAAAAVAVVGGGFNVVVSFNKRKIFSELQQL